MNIVVASSEVAPLAKTGGLADVCSALPRALAGLGHQVAVVMPAHRAAKQAAPLLEPTGIQFHIPIGSKTVPGGLLKTRLPGSEVPVYLVEQDDYFDRPGLYGENNHDYIDNCERFVFFCRALLEAVRLLPMQVDVLHCNDWQTGLVPAYLKLEYAGVPGYEQVASLLTIHNLAFQGTFWHWDMLLTGLDWKYFNWQQMEFFGQLNLLKTGLVFADAINTVSPRYAEEIQTSPLGCGLEGVLHQRREALTGILNGIDQDEWNPATDAYLPQRYDRQTFVEGKAACKASLQQELGLQPDARRPLIGFIGRLTEQKGIDLIAPVLQSWLESEPAQWVILGTGDPKYHDILSRLAMRYPDSLCLRLEFSDRLAHCIEAAADMIVLPSRFEPCGLTQMYSLRYGAVPVVRATGGLADTIVDCTDETLAAGTANGFRFEEYTPGALSDTLRRAAEWYAQPQRWQALVRLGMAQDWSWRRSAEQYVALYRSLVARKTRETGFSASSSGRGRSGAS